MIVLIFIKAAFVYNNDIMQIKNKFICKSSKYESKVEIGIWIMSSHAIKHKKAFSLFNGKGFNIF